MNYFKVKSQYRSPVVEFVRRFRFTSLTFYRMRLEEVMASGTEYEAWVISPTPKEIEALRHAVAQIEYLEEIT